MKVLKNPLVAVVLSLAIIVGSSFASARMKLSKECQKLTDGFYSGVKYDGYMHKSISSQIENLTGAVSGMITIANSNSVDTTELSAVNHELLTVLSASGADISKINSLYRSVADSSIKLADELSALKLSERERSGLNMYLSTINGAQKLIGEAGYNESIGSFTSGLDTLSLFFLDATHVQLPEVFN